MAAWQSERSAKESRDELSNALQNAESQRSQLECDAERHAKAQKELDALYEGIFSGPTPDVPGEDALEEKVRGCKADYEGCHEHAGREKQAVQALGTAEQALHAGYSDIQDALRRSGRDMVSHHECYHCY